MKRDAVIKAVRAAARSGALVYSGYAVERMANRDPVIARGEVAAHLSLARGYQPQTQGHWRVFGGGMAVIVEVRDGVVVVRNAMWT